MQLTLQLHMCRRSRSPGEQQQPPPVDHKDAAAAAWIQVQGQQQLQVQRHQQSCSNEVVIMPQASPCRRLPSAAAAAYSNGGLIVPAVDEPADGLLMTTEQRQQVYIYCCIPLAFMLICIGSCMPHIKHTSVR